MNARPADFDAVLGDAQGGDGRGFEALYRWLGPPVLGYVRSCRVEDPDDLANEVFLRGFRSIGTFRGDADRFQSWIFTIAHNTVADERRRRRRRPVCADAEVPDVSTARDAADELLARLALDQVETVLAQLSPDQREVFVLRVLGDLSVSQTAAVVGKSYEAVKALQRRGVATLKRYFAAQGVPK